MEIGTSRRGYICLFQVFGISYKDKHFTWREQCLPSGKCTLEAAKEMLKAWSEERAYSRRYELLAPDAVRFLDKTGAELQGYAVALHPSGERCTASRAKEWVEQSSASSIELEA